METGMNGRLKPLAYERMGMLVDGAVVIETKAREPLDPDAQSNWGQTRFSSFERTRASLVRGTLMLGCPRAFESGATQR